MHVIRSQFLRPFILLLGLAFSVYSHAAPPTFSLAFSPSTIGPGSISTVTYTINNSAEAAGVTGLSFTNTLPTGVTVANPSRASTSCIDGTLTATAGSGNVTISGYRLSAVASCTVTLDVTSSTPGAHVNTTGALATSAGSAGTATANLTVDAGRPGFLMAFSPSSITPGADSTLTYTFDNSLNGSGANVMVFSNTLPTGVVLSDQPLSTTTCNSSSTPVITAVAQASRIDFSKGSVTAGASCTFSVNVTAANAGEYSNVSGALSQNGSNASGAASATLTVGNPFISAYFPASVTPGASATLSFTLNNTDRDNAATGITFTNDLNSTLSGLAATVLPANDFCGSGSTLTGSSTITVAGASLAAGASCSFELTVLIPTNAAASTYTNNTSTLNLTLGSATTKPAFSHSLVVKKSPVLTMAFIDDPANLGEDVTLRFTVTNTDTANEMSAFTFTQEIDAVYAGITINTVPNANSCGTGSTFTSGVVDEVRVFTVAGGTIVAGGNCTFDVVLTLPELGPPGSFVYTTSAPTSVVNGEALSSNTANDTLVILAAAQLSIALADEAAVPGSIVAAELSLEYTESAVADISGLGFTIDLEAALTGMTMATGTASDVCGAGSSISGTSTITFTGGSLAAGAKCTFSVTLQIPSGATPSTYTLISSAVTGTTAAQATNSGAASDTQIITGLAVSKIFLTSTALAGDAITARYTITNAATALAASAMEFTDRLSQALSTLAATSLPAQPCGVGSTITGTTSLTFSGGSLAPGELCTFDVLLLIPAGASAGAYNSPTESMSATVNGNNTETPKAAAILYVEALEAVIASTASNPTLTSPIPVTIHFDRSVVNFAVEDLTITNGSASNFSGSGQSYSADITPDATGDVVISLQANVVDDAVNSSVKNTAESLTIEYAAPPANVVVTVPASAVNTVGSSYTISGSHAIDVSRVYLYADSDNDGVADNNTVLASATAAGGTWSMTATLSFQVANNFVVVWEDRLNRVNRAVNVPTITEVTPNFDPVISGTPSTSIAEDASYSFTPTMTDANSNDTHTFSITNKPTWASFSASTGALTGTPLNADVGSHSNIVITVTDSSTLSASLAAFAIAVSNTNDAPVISGTPSGSVAEDAAYSFTPSVNDVDVSDTATFSIANQPSWANFSTSTGVLSGTPTNDDIGVTSSIVITVTDAASAADSLVAFSLTVTNTNDAPVISGTPSTTVAEDAAYSFTPAVADVDAGDTATFSIANAPSWASFNTSTGALTGTPVNSDVGVSSNIVITVTDTASASDSLAAFSITVSNTNDAPAISGAPATTIAEDSAYSFTPVVNDDDSGDSTTFSIANQPSWASFSASTGVLSGTPTNDDIGVTSNIVITVTDSASAADSLAAFNLTVSNTNDAPVISGSPSTTVAEDASYSFTPSVSDVDASDTATFSIANPPSWANFSTTTGALTGTPTNSDVGSTTGIVITVTDTASASDSLAAFSLTVTNTNDVVVISGTPSTSVNEDAAYSFTPTVADDDVGDTATFSISNAPSWASFNTATGALTGTPTNSDVGVSSNIVISATDSATAVASLAAFSITVNNTNDAPTISGTPNTAAPEDALYSFTPSSNDVDSGDTRAFSITNQPSWASFSTSTGVLTGTPTNADIGLTSNIVITVTDAASATASLAAFTITVSNTNDAPVISGSPSTTVAQDASYSFTPTVSDDDSGDTATFSITNGPSWASFNSSTGALTGTPSNSDVGLSSNIVITVVDGASAADSLAAFTITVTNINDAPVMSGTPSTTVAEDAAYSFTPTVNDIDAGDTATFSITNRPTWASFSASTGVLSGTPTNDDIGVTSNIVITVTDSASATDSLAAFNLTVSNTNDAPVITGTPSTAVAEDTSYSFTPAVTDDDAGDAANFSIVNSPAWASFNSATGALTGTPTNDDIGVTSNIVITVTDSASATASLAAFSITVSNVNDAPTITGTPAATIDEDSLYSFTPTANDVDTGDSLTFSITNAPTWASFNASTGALTGTPTNSDVGTTSAIEITVTDSASATASLATFSLTVSNTNDAPVISGMPSNSVAEDSTYGFTPTASDVDAGDTLSFSISNAPSWTSFDASTGALTGTPTNDNIGLTSNIVITVTDSASATASLAAFSISVGNTNDAPTISGTPATVVDEDVSYSFTPEVADVDSGDTLSFSIVNAPAWGSFNTATGALTGTPTNSDVGSHANIVISATDSGGATASLAAFTITVSNINDAPEISGTPSTMAPEDASYSFTPVVIDVDAGDTQTFAISSPPSWATFNAATGALTGTPSNNDLGQSSGVVITVSDAAGASASLPAFNIVVSNTNDALVISGTPDTTVPEDTAYSFTPEVSDDDVGDTVVFSIQNMPDWAAFDTATGALTGTPDNSHVGVWPDFIWISATDGGGATSNLAPFTLTVTNTNDAPVISGTPASAVAEDASYSFTPEVSDDDAGDTQTFTITNPPSWASFDAATGALTGTPTNADIGLTSDIVITVSDTAEVTDSLPAFSVLVTNTNDALMISGAPSATANEDALYTFVPTISDDDVGDSAVFSVTNLPIWASFDPATGALMGTPSNSDVGASEALIVISAMDSGGAISSLAPFTLTVNNTNDAPTISGTPTTAVDEDASYSFTPVVADEDVGDTHTFSVENKPSWATFDALTGSLMGTPANDDVGQASGIVITVTDEAGASASLLAFNIVVINTNDVPIISGAPDTTILEDILYSFTPEMSDVDVGDTVVFSVRNAPGWATFDTTTGTLSGTPSNSDVGLWRGAIFIFATDSSGAVSRLPRFTFTVINVNDAPLISGTPATEVAEDANYSFASVFSDVDEGDTLIFTIENKPSWASFDTTSGVLTGTPTNNDVGTSANIVITVADSENATASLAPFNIVVNNTNDAPVISGTPSTTIAEDAPYSFAPDASDVDANDVLTLSISNKPAWVSFDAATGALTGTPDNSHVGVTSDIVLSVTDLAGAVSSLAAFSLAVTNTNDAPEISGTPQALVAEDSLYSFTPSVNEVDQGDTTTFSVDNKPLWATFDLATGTLTGTPSNADVGAFNNIVISVSDTAGATASLPAFNITVQNTNDAPAISGIPSISIDEDALYSFTPTVTDDDAGDALTFAVINLPVWASFDVATGTLMGTPSNGDVGVYADIVVSVNDGADGTSSLAAFNLTVNNINDAPEITGSPNTTVIEDEPYSFTPAVNDVDRDDSHTFSITNAPAWASFNTATGALTGTPGSDDVAVHGGIVITVVDSANAEASLAVFSISVTNVNDAPVISGTPNATAAEDALYRFTPTVVDPDASDIKVFTITNLPEWLTFNPSNGGLTGTPDNTHIGIYSDIVISVADSADATDSLPAFSITVVNANDAPVAVDDQFVLSFNSEGYLLDVLQNDTDEDGDALTILSVSSVLEGLTIEEGQLRFIPAFELDSAEFEYLVSDGNGGQDTAIVTLTINADSTAAAGPQITVPPDVEVNATGLFTRVDLGVATAKDASGNTLPVTLLNGNKQFAAGIHKAYWQATDAAGNSTVREQEVRVNPLVSLAKGQQVIEGSSVRIGIILSGKPPEYPVVVPYSVSGTADEGDHSLMNGEVSLTSLQGEILLDVFADGVFEESETIVVTLTGETLNAGSQNTHTIAIVEGNLAPQVSLLATQEEEPRLLMDAAGNTIVISATVVDANPADGHTFVWQFIEGVEDLDATDNTFSINPADLIPGQYSVTVTVSDDGLPSKSVENTVYFEIIDELPVLTSDDSDGDLIPDNLEGLGDDDGDGIANYLDDSDAAVNVLPSKVSEQNKYLMEGPAGAHLRKGSFAAGNEQGGGVLSELDVDLQLVPDSEAQSVGVIFDFVMYGLPAVGASYSIVLPQQEAIPFEALYRKYVNGTWVDFVVNERNGLYSAAGEAGYCPPPESDSWQAGLTEGDWCVQLSIEDGGPNDDDGLANGTIVDPGGIAVALSNNSFPVVVNDSGVTFAGAALTVNILGNDTDADEDTLVISSATANIGASTIGENGELTYTPPENFIGTDEIIYSITDGNGGTASGTLTVEVVQQAAAVAPTTPVNARVRGGAMNGLTLLMFYLMYCGVLGCYFMKKRLHKKGAA